MRWTMEIMGQFDGAMVRLATLSAEVTLRAQVYVTDGGGTALQTEDVEVVSTAAQSGLLPELTPAEAEIVSVTFASQLIDSMPLWTLPRLGDAPPSKVKFIPPYLMFTDG